MIILNAITGASCLPLAIRFLRVLGKLGVERHLIISKSAQCVQRFDQKTEIVDWMELSEVLYPVDDVAAAVCSGSYEIDGMVIVPCSMNTLAHIANGLEHNAITRAASVNLKQQKKVVLVPRETPLSLIHIKNMYQAKLAGCSIVLPLLGFYYRPETIDDILDHICGKVLELLNIPHNLYTPWQEIDRN